jgi:hypothetical protein
MLPRVVSAVLLAAAIAPAQRGVPSDWQAVMNRVRPESIRGHLSFLASDLLEGRGTPSRGLEIAAEYIASQFRRIGLEPVIDAGFFQPLDLREAAVDLEGFECRLDAAPVSGVPLSRDGIQVDREPLLPVTSTSVDARGAVIVFRGDVSRPRDVLKALGAIDAKLIIVVDPIGRVARAALRIAAVPAGQEPNVPAGRWLFVPSFPENLAPDARITVKAKPVSIRPLSARNVVGLMRGSDPALRDTYLVVSAHYDHEGMRPFGTGDRIYNGANDNASGVTGMLEMAAAFAPLPERPKRSILFVAFTAEEDGMLGSSEFVRHPPVPIGQIVANVNFEHLGRPDADGTSYLRKATITGYGYTSISTTLTEVGRLSGIEYLKHEKYNDAFFKASDNLSFAEVGIPAHTVSNGFIFPEYHAPGDEWQKIDSENMAALVRSLSLGVLTLADDARAPQWNETNEKTEEYRKSTGR